MANALYDLGREGFLAGTIPFGTADIKMVLIDETDHTVNLATDNALDDIAAAAREEISANFASKTLTAGVADATDPVFSATSGDACDSMTIYEDSGVESTSELICNIDTAGGLPVTLGGDVTVQFDSGANKIFKL